MTSLWVPGFDIAKYQGEMTCAKAKRAGLKFGYIRGAKGLNRDEFTLRNASRAKRNAMLFGIYLFFHPAIDIGQQTDLLIQLHKSTGATLVPMIDVEAHDALAAFRITRGLHRMVTRLTIAVGKPPTIYTGAGFWNKYVHDVTYSHCPLWTARYAHKTVAQYRADPVPIDPSKWAEYAFMHPRPLPVIGWDRPDAWQFAGENNRCGKRYGASSLDLDVNIMREESLHKFLVAA